MDVKTVHGFVGNKLSFARASADAGLKLAEAMDAEALIAKVGASGLRGRGGAGFPTGLKWEFARAETRTPKYIICNADEGEPGTFKDRLILTDFPDLVFAGMAIAGKAVGAEKGILYLRAEYGWLRAHLEDALSRRRKARLLGDAILGNEEFSFDIEIRMGAGAYICGEETALLESLEGPAAKRATASHSRYRPAIWASPRSSTMSRHSPGSLASWTRVRIGLPPMGTKSPRAPAV